MLRLPITPPSVSQHDVYRGEPRFHLPSDSRRRVHSHWECDFQFGHCGEWPYAAVLPQGHAADRKSAAASIRSRIAVVSSMLFAVLLTGCHQMTRSSIDQTAEANSSNSPRRNFPGQP